ncbi:nucleotidyltransferase family protein [Mucilaginibacter phyllosphaerae]|uniref:nucleotidyltransferase family protein n=1 Tax=Mucilaginibacter phyllosphaerae TaxID=1812349 RepID=UPI0035A2231A
MKRAAIFGSVAKGESSDSSDIDLLIKGGQDFTMFKMLSLEQEISKLINKKLIL